MKATIFIACVCLLMRIMSLSPIASAEIRGAPETARNFVQEFYGWYVPKVFDDEIGRPWEVAVESRSGDFSRDLKQLLKEDSEAQAGCRDLIGIDFDPFLNTQDPASSYEVGEIEKANDHYRAEIYRVHAGKRSENAIVSVEVADNNGKWFFENFHYPIGSNLLQLLKSPKLRCDEPRQLDQNRRFSE